MDVILGLDRLDQRKDTPDLRRDTLDPQGTAISG
jgi:hypothetical protein